MLRSCEGLSRSVVHAFTDCLQNHRNALGMKRKTTQNATDKYVVRSSAASSSRVFMDGSPRAERRRSRRAEVSQAHRQYQDEARDGVDEYEVHVVIELDLRYQASDGADPCKVEEIREDYCDRTKRIRERDTSDPADMGDDHRRDVRALEHRGRSNADVGAVPIRPGIRLANTKYMYAAQSAMKIAEQVARLR